MLNLVLVGLNHRTAEVGIRERAAFAAARLPDALSELARRPGVEETMIISTCNRVELLARVRPDCHGEQALETFLSEESGIPLPELKTRLYCHTGAEAVRHLLRVASSLDSMVLGEPQILGQVKSFYSLAVEAHTVGTFLNTIVQTAFKVAKRVRSDTSIGEYSVSVSSAAVELARKIFGSLKDRSILIIGAGKMGEVAVRHLAAAGAKTIRVTNRSLDAARELAAKFSGAAVPFDQLPYWMARSDVILVSTGAQHMIVTRAMAHALMAERKHAPVVFVDISVPRNVDPEVAQIENVFCYDVDDLGAVVDANLTERRKEAAAAERIVEQEVASLCARLRSLDVGPVVVQVQDRIGQICRDELERYLRKSGPRDPGEIKELESMVARIASKIAHPLVTHVRSIHQDQHQQAYLESIKRMFKSDEKKVSDLDS
jgi:glutamyl-tRNA reductase